MTEVYSDRGPATSRPSELGSGWYISPQPVIGRLACWQLQGEVAVGPHVRRQVAVEWAAGNVVKADWWVIRVTPEGLEIQGG